MYIPKQFLLDDTAKLISFMKTYSFGLMITAENNSPTATHLPFIIEQRENDLYLLSHVAKANPQWKSFKNNVSILVVFSGPHAYISPSNYKTLENVPTWNYTAVHVYGTAQLLEGENQKQALLEHTIHTYEQAYQNQWQLLSNNYKNKLMNEIVAFEIKVKELEGKFKLSQNKLPEEKDKIIQSLEYSDNPKENELGIFMKKIR